MVTKWEFRVICVETQKRPMGRHWAVLRLRPVSYRKRGRVLVVRPLQGKEDRKRNQNILLTFLFFLFKLLLSKVWTSTSVSLCSFLFPEDM